MTRALIATTLGAALAPTAGAAFAGITLYHYLFLSAAMFVIGVIGFLTRRNMIIIFLCTELMFQGAALALIAFGRYWNDKSGDVFVIIVLTIAAAEAALALGLVVYLFRRKGTLDALAWAELKG